MKRIIKHYSFGTTRMAQTDFAADFRLSPTPEALQSYSLEPAEYTVPPPQQQQPCVLRVLPPPPPPPLIIPVKLDQTQFAPSNASKLDRAPLVQAKLDQIQVAQSALSVPSSIISTPNPIVVNDQVKLARATPDNALPARIMQPGKDPTLRVRPSGEDHLIPLRASNGQAKLDPTLGKDPAVSLTARMDTSRRTHINVPAEIDQSTGKSLAPHIVQSEPTKFIPANGNFLSATPTRLPTPVKSTVTSSVQAANKSVSALPEVKKTTRESEISEDDEEDEAGGEEGEEEADKKTETDVQKKTKARQKWCKEHLKSLVQTLTGTTVKNSELTAAYNNLFKTHKETMERDYAGYTEKKAQISKTKQSCIPLDRIPANLRPAIEKKRARPSDGDVNDTPRHAKAAKALTPLKGEDLNEASYMGGYNLCGNLCFRPSSRFIFYLSPVM